MSEKHAIVEKFSVSEFNRQQKQKHQILLADQRLQGKIPPSSKPESQAGPYQSLCNLKSKDHCVHYSSFAKKHFKTIKLYLNKAKTSKYVFRNHQH